MTNLSDFAKLGAAGAYQQGLRSGDTEAYRAFKVAEALGHPEAKKRADELAQLVDSKTRTQVQGELKNFFGKKA